MKRWSCTKLNPKLIKQYTDVLEYRKFLITFYTVKNSDFFDFSWENYLDKLEFRLWRDK